MEKYGFIYVWFDKGYNRFYVGRHWGHVNDGYICSSNSMRDAHRRRPMDFKRRIVSVVHTKEALIIEEQRWLDMIKPTELNNKYYNKTQKATTPSTLGYSHSDETKTKIASSNTGKKRSETTKENIRKSLLDQYENTNKRELISQQQKKIWSDPEYRNKMSNIHKGKPGNNTGPMSEETKNKLRLINTGKKHSEQTKEKLRTKTSNIIYINNGEICRSHPKEEIIPVGFVKGRLKTK